MGPNLVPTTQHHALSRSPSSPSLAVGLPPPLPESNIMAPSTPTSAGAKKRPRDKIPSRRGDVESSVASSPESDDEIRRVRLVPRAAPIETTPTPKRKVLNAVEGATPSRTAPKKRYTLAERLAMAASTSSSVSGSTSGHVSDSVPPSTAVQDYPAVTAPLSMALDDFKGSEKVIVCVRIKPTNAAFATTAYELAPTSLTLAEAHPNVQRRGGKSGREAEYTYTFDTLLRFPARTPDLYQAKVAPLVEKAMKGFNSTVFAYGQTGSGKSFTMSGTPSELGIIPCAVDGIFDAITADPDRAFLLRVSYIEIYNETLRDLLCLKKTPLRDDEKPSIHTAKGKVYVEPLVEEIVSTPQDVVDILERGNLNRKTGSTDWNERSSRSHAVFTIVIESRPRDAHGSEDIRLSRLSLIDLAGSEKAVSDVDRRGEGKHINQSLLALREVVHKLTEKGKRSHIPYRNSKLTHLLENALGGDSNICVICTLSAEEEHCSETLETLKFAGRCSQVETKAQKNVLPSSERAVIRAKDLEIEELKRQLEGLVGSQRPQSESSEQIAELAGSLASMEARKAKLAAQLAKLNGEILTSELPRYSSGFPLSPPRVKRPRISDFTSLSTAALGLGTPKKVVVDRRAVSGLVRVPESGENDRVLEDTAKNFNHDRIIAALRRNITAKEDELVNSSSHLATALAELEQLRASMTTAESEYETKLRDAMIELESTRAELVRTVADKSTQIDALETSVLDLRKSREELAVEDLQRLQAVQVELGAKTAELSASAKEVDLMRKDLESKTREVETKNAEVEERTRQLDSLRESHRKEVSNIKTAVRALRAQADEAATRATALEMTCTEREKACTTMATNLATIETERDNARGEIAMAQQNYERVTAELESLRHSATSRESDVLSGLRLELDNEKEACRRVTADFAVVQAQLAKVMAEMNQLRADLKTAVDEATRKNIELEAAKTALEASEATKIELERRVDVEVSAANHAREERDEATGALDKAMQASTSNTAKLVTELEVIKVARQDQERELESLRFRLEETSSQLKNERTKRDDANNLQHETSKLHDDVSRQLDEARKMLEKEQRERARLGNEVTVAITRAETLTIKLAEVQREMENEGQAIASAVDEAHKELQATRQEVIEERRARAEAEKLLKTRHNTELAEALKTTGDTKALLSQEQETRAEAERLLLQNAESRNNDRREMEKMAAELSTLRAQLMAVKSNEERLARESMNNTTAVPDLPRPRHDATASVPNTPSTSASNALHRGEEVATKTRSGSILDVSRLKRTSETEEIDRLDNVVQMQTIIIEEQREKIKFWAEELEKQRELVRLLTQDGAGSSSALAAVAAATEEFKDHTLSPTPLRGSTADSQGATPRPNTPVAPTTMRTHARKIYANASQSSSAKQETTHTRHLPSTFAARNLALPSVPTPLPMHQGQLDQALRKSRRVTIEHDIDRLFESSKVNKIKGVFDSTDPAAPTTPAKLPATSRGEKTSVPRQRRP